MKTKTTAAKKPIEKLTAAMTLFGETVASGVNQGEAYRLAYPGSKNWKDSSVWPKASQLAKHPTVAKLIAELRERATKAAVLTLQDHLVRLDEISRAAQAAKDYNAAARAEEARGRASGFYVQKMEHTGKNGGPIETKQTRDLTDTELNEALKAHGIAVPGHSNTKH